MNFSSTVFSFLRCRFEQIDNYLVDPNMKLVATCFNGGKTNLFMVGVDVTLVTTGSNQSKSQPQRHK